MKFLLTFLFILFQSFACASVKLFLGFEGKTPSDPGVIEIAKAIEEKKVQGVILFTRNIEGPDQLKTLTAFLRERGCAYISVDQEGGRVARLRASTGFKDFPSAKAISQMSGEDARSHYHDMAKLLKEMGINFVFGPCVDLDKGSPVIGGLERSYGKDAKEVIKYAEIYGEEFQNQGILTCLKHFPGHSDGDTHKGFVEAQNWTEEDLIPYQNVKASSIMTSHMTVPFFDEDNPISLSEKAISYIRKSLGFKGDIVTDDLGMGAMLRYFSIKDIVEKAIKAGHTILLFGRNKKALDTAELSEEQKEALMKQMSPDHLHKLIREVQQ